MLRMLFKPRWSAKLGMAFFACCAMLCMPGCGSNSPTVGGEPTLDSIDVSPMNQSVPVGATLQFKATGNYSDGSTKDLTTTAMWASTDTTVATVSNTAGTNGLATGVGRGSANIKATFGTPVGQTGFSVTEPITAIAIIPTNATVASGFSDQFSATATYADGSTGDITTASTTTWSSDTPSVATISNVAAFNGLASAFAQGSANIAATSGGVSSLPFSLTVTAAIPVGLLVSPQNPVIADAGGTQQFKALAQYSDGTTKDVSSSATWSSNNTNVATVSSTGVATSLGLTSGTAGFTSISASWAVSAPAVTVRKSKKSVSSRAASTSQSSSGATVSGVSILSVTLHTGNGYAGTLTQHNDNSRTGQNLNEAVLASGGATPVNSTNFGKLFSQLVDGYVFAQPLYVPNVTIPSKGVHNVIYVATENDSVYAFDADSNASAPNNAPLWKVTLLDSAHGSGPHAFPVNATGGAQGVQADVVCGNITALIGITSTPVIDPSTNTMYVAAESKEGTTGNFTYYQRLHALDITTGAEKSQGPVVIGGSVPGTSDGSTTVNFVPLMHLSRPGLLLLNGIVYIAYSSNCDNTPYHGWVFSYNASTFTQTGIYATTANGSSATGGLGGIWMSGCGIAADASGSVFLVSGNGDFDTVNVPAVNTSDSMLKFSQRGNVLALVDYFTPSDQDALDTSDLDLGSAGLSLLPDGIGPAGHPNLLVQAGKKGNVYLVDRDQMTTGNQHYCSGCTSDTNVVQELPTAIGGMWSMPAYWNNNVYLWGIGDALMQYSLSNGILSNSPTHSSTLVLQYPGSVPTVSASATTNGIVWAIDATNSGGTQPAQAVLHAFDATNVSTELYNSTQATGNRDKAGVGVKFTVPTVANGKVYIGTQTEIDVYGLLP